jgi:phosphoglycolate phosphatase-like HAD superfamily hydrolase
LIELPKVVFWDFDGVIKDSVKVKSDAFEQIFLPFGQKIATKVRSHHEANGGVSRFDKLPIYLKWSGQDPSREILETYVNAFSARVTKNVVNSPWVPGVFNYLKNNHQKKDFFLVTATPQKEIEYITKELGIRNFFKEIAGSPINKADAMQKILVKYGVSPEHAVMIGDSRDDYMAASSNKIEFVLRKTNLNTFLQCKLNCKMIEDFYYE